MVGQKFKTKNCGEVIVQNYTNDSNIIIVFINTGTTLKTSKRVLVSDKPPRLRDPLSKTVFGIGYIGVGKHKAHIKSADTKSFSIWRAMLRRCYYEPERKAWREGYTVDKEWHNFQNFAEWFEKNYPKNGNKYQLDKDIITNGNKVYSPKDCSFVTQHENLAARKYKKDRKN